MIAALEWGVWSAARLGRTLPPGKTQHPFYRRLGGPQGRSGRAENLVPTGIRSRTVQPVAQSLYRLRYPAHILSQVGLHNCVDRNGIITKFISLDRIIDISMVNINNGFREGPQMSRKETEERNVSYVV